MYRLVVKMLLVAGLFFAIIPGIANAASPHSTPTITKSLPMIQPHASRTGKIGGMGIRGCRVQIVNLHGSQPATMTCGDHPQTKGGSPFTTVNQGSNNCNTADVSVWWDNDEQGPEICFTGDGYTFLGSYCAWIGILCFNWARNASSYELQNCTLYESYAGVFVAEYQTQSFDLIVSKSPGNFDGTGGRLPNDSLLDVDISC